MDAAAADVRIRRGKADLGQGWPEYLLVAQSRGPAAIRVVPLAHARFRNASSRSSTGAPVLGTEWPAPRMIARSALSSCWRTSQIASNTELWPPEVTSFGKEARLSALNGTSASYGPRCAIVVSTPC